MTTDDSKDPILILASQSPRRRYLLEQAGLSFSVIPSRFDEEAVPFKPGDAPEEYVRKLAQGKALEVSARYPRSWIIGADTTVMIQGKNLGKPSSDAEAFEMLKQLSGQTHEVHTGFCICSESAEKRFSQSVRTEVLFKTLTHAEIDWYIKTGEPFDKAGGYGIQGFGIILVRSINGSYTNVVGLPVCEVIETLIREGIAGFCSGNGFDLNRPENVSSGAFG